MRTLFLVTLAMVLLASLVLGGCAGSAPSPSTTQASQPAASNPSSSQVPSTQTAKTSSPPTATASSPSSQSGTITLNWVGFQPRNNVEYTPQNLYIVDKIKEKTNGQLIIKFIGGPETIPAMDIGMAVKNGVVDIGQTYVGGYEAIVPGISLAQFTKLTPAEEQKPGGAYYYMQEMHKKAGLFYLGRHSPYTNGFFYTFLSDRKLENPADFKGFRMGVGAVARPGAMAWGCASEILVPTDIYSAFEHKLISGTTGVPISNPRQYGWYERIKYVIDEGYFASTAMMFMNLNSWNKLPKNWQELIEKEIMPQYEVSALAFFDKLEKDEREFLVSKGVQFYKLSEENTKWYLDTLTNATWAEQEKKYPQVSADLKPLLIKK
jgi:TRAP-type transport system periplasmic protein